MPASASDPAGADELVALAKADLHLHLVGSAAPHTVAALAATHPESGLPADVEALRSFYRFRDFDHFLRVYTAVSDLIRSPEDIVMLVSGLAEDLARQGTPYAEVTVTPFAHRRAGIAPRELAGALELGARLARHGQGVELAFVYDISTSDGEEGAAMALDVALRHPPAGLVGFGLGGPETGIRRADFAPYFAKARAAGLHSVPHAGESVGPSEIYAALDLLGAERIGHGIAAASDDVLLARLAGEGVPLELCPSSSVATGVVASFAEHPLARLLAAGVPVVLCSDDPPMFDTNLPEEYRRARDVLGLSNAQLRDLARRSIEASFAPPGLKRRLLADWTASAASGRGRCELIFHVTTETAWQEALAKGEYRLSTRDRTLDEEGFVHCSLREQLDDVARSHFEGVDALVVLAIDPSLTGAEVRMEWGGGGRRFPHLYGPISLHAVVSAERFVAGEGGTHPWPPHRSASSD